MVTPKNQEQLVGTQATIACIVSGLNQELTKVEWKKSDNSLITDGADNFSIDIGTYEQAEKSQTTILTVPDSETTEDKTYTCIISSGDQEFIDQETTVNLKVFCK